MYQSTIIQAFLNYQNVQIFNKSTKTFWYKQKILKLIANNKKHIRKTKHLHIEHNIDKKQINQSI